jgi:hypothetical protein
MRIVDRWWHQRRFETVPFYVSAALVLGYGIWTGVRIVSWITLVDGTPVAVGPKPSEPVVAQRPIEVEATGSVRRR